MTTPLTVKNLCKLLVVAVTATLTLTATAQQVSRPGEYSGYSPALYDGYKMTSQYVAVRDGTKLAVDIIRPTLNGVVVDKKLPVVWMNTPYNRRRTNGGGTGTTADSYPGAALDLVKYGYVVAVADMRGNYASFGRAVHYNRNEWMPWAYWDAYDITEWLAAQAWSDSQIGMWGCSATGHSQWQAAATNPPHLKAIVPLSGPSEYYDWNGITPIFDKAPPLEPYPGEIPKADAAAVAVDEDHDGTLLQAAKEEHRANLDYGYIPYRNSVSPEMAAYLGLKDFKPHLEVNTFSHFDDLNRARIPAYQSANFGEDQRVKLGIMVKMHNLKSPLKTIFGPGDHCNWSSESRKNEKNEFVITTEELRWFDYWLKGVKNGVMDEPPIYLYTYNRPKEKSWQFAWQWPLPTDKSTNFYFGPAAIDGVKGGVNNGTLGTAAPSAAAARDDYKVDYDVTPENQNQRGMTYTTAPLSVDTTLIGHPVVHLWISSTATDGDFATFLADIAPDGKVTPLPGTDDGRLRASFRALNEPPYNNLGLPYHRSFAEDVKPLVPGAPTELVFDMAPVSWVFKAGHRIRLIVNGVGDAHRGRGPAPTPVLSPAPVVSFYRDSKHSSYVTLPVNAPVSATVSIVPGKSSMVARVTFPRTMDSRYLKDIRAGSIMSNGVVASSTRIDGDTLIAEFDPGALKSGDPVTVKGEFGNQYYYGDLMTFTGTGTVPKR